MNSLDKKLRCKRRIVLNYQGQTIIYYNVCHSERQAIINAIHSLEKDLSKVFGSLIPYFRDMRDKEQFSLKVEVQLL